MCRAHDPVTDLQCLRSDQHDGEHIAMGRDGHAKWTVTWHNPDSIRALLAAAEGAHVGAN